MPAKVLPEIERIGVEPDRAAEEGVGGDSEVEVVEAVAGHFDRDALDVGEVEAGWRCRSRR